MTDLQRGFKRMDGAIAGAFKPTAPADPATPEAIYRGIMNSPVKLLDYVRKNTGYEGEQLINEAIRYSSDMKRRI